jgi:hypothetical protein
VWSDIILAAERQYLARLLVWAALSLVAGTAVFTLVAARRVRSPLLKHFAIQMLAWGLIVAGLTARAWNGLHLRDLAGAARLERVTWMTIGLDVGIVAVGVTLVAVGRAVTGRMGLVGAGAAFVIQGAALFLLALQFAVVVSR